MRLRSWPGLGLPLAAAALLPVMSRAQDAASPDLLAVVAQAPALQAARHRIEAARARTDSAGRLANPEIEAMSSRINADAMGENRDMWEFNLRQPLPKRGERAADRERTRAAVTVAESEFAMIAGDLAADVVMALAEAEGAETRGLFLAAQRSRLDAVLQSIDSRLANGGAARLGDRLTVQSRIAALELQLAQAQLAADDARASARARLGLAPDAALPAYAAPAPAEINPADAATVAVAQARIAEANAMGRMARASANPMTAVGLRFERERSSMGNQDTLGVAVSSEIPWHTRRYARADGRAAAADRAAAQADAVNARHRIAGALSRVARADRLAVLARRLAGETQVRLEAEHTAVSAGVSVGAGTGMGGESPVFHAVDIFEKSTETQLQIIEAETAARVARAELWRYVPAPRLLAPSLPPIATP